MRAFTRLGWWFGAAMLCGAIASACGGTGETNGTTTGMGTGGSTSTTTSTSSSGGGMGGASTSSSSSSSSSSSGTGGMGSAGDHGPQSSQLVNGGDVVKSPGYKMVFTLGQPTQNQSKTTSPSYRMQGGLIGANGTLP